MKLRSVNVFAPATVANLGPGFDILGLALDAPGDIVTATQTKEPGLVFSAQGPVKTPNDKQNVAAHVAKLLLDECKPSFGVAMTLQKHMPIGSGLGSSGASAAASAFAINSLLPKPLAKKDLIPFAMEGERIAAGSAHADNVAPALLGGLCVIRSYDPLDVIQLPIKNNWYWIVAHPHCVVETERARNLLPKTVSLPTLVQQTGNLAGFLSGLLAENADIVQRSLQDIIAEPVRATLIPAFDAVKDAALRAGALGFSIAGSGPTVFAVAPTSAMAIQIATAMKITFLNEAALACDTYVSLINVEGAKLMEPMS